MAYLKLLFLFLLVLGAVSFSGCGRSKNDLDNWIQEGGKKKILCTTAQLGDLVAEIGGERVDALVLISGDLDPHSYELVKGDGEKIARADLIFYNGLGLEHGASLSSLLRAQPKAIPIGERIAQQCPERILKRGGVLDPHLWMDISLWKEAIEPMREELSALDPESAPYYAERAEQLRQKMVEVDAEIYAQLQAIPAEKRYLVTSHDAFQYFTRRYLAEPGEENWAIRFAAPEGLSPDGQLNPIDLQNIVRFLHAYGIATLFPESNVSRDSIRKIALAGKELGLQVQICSEVLYGDSTSGLLYLDSMRQNAHVIASYLGR